MHATETPFTYRKSQEEELVEEDRVFEGSARFYGFPDLPGEREGSGQVPQHLGASPPCRVRHRGERPRALLSSRPHTTHPHSRGQVSSHRSRCTAPRPATLPAGPKEVERTQKPSLSTALHPRRPPHHFPASMISSGKSLLTAHHLLGTSALQNKRHSPYPQEALGPVSKTGGSVLMHHQGGRATSKGFRDPGGAGEVGGEG